MGGQNRNFWNEAIMQVLQANKLSRKQYFYFYMICPRHGQIILLSCFLFWSHWKNVSQSEHFDSVFSMDNIPPLCLCIIALKWQIWYAYHFTLSNPVVELQPIAFLSYQFFQQHSSCVWCLFGEENYYPLNYHFESFPYLSSLSSSKMGEWQQIKN